MKKNIKVFGLLVIVAALFMPFQNCAELFPSDHSDGSASSSGIDLAQLEAEAVAVLRAECASCHRPGSGVDTPIADITDLQALEDDGYIVIGSPQTSQLYLDLIDGVMPPSPNDPLSDLDLERIRVWLLGENVTSDDISAIVGGGSGGGGAGSGAATFAEVFDMVIAPQCLGCHSAGDNRGSLADYDDIRDYVVPGDPFASDLFLRVNSNDMPRGGAAPVSAFLKSRIANWITNGAQP